MTCPCGHCCRPLELPAPTVTTGRYQPSRRDRDERYTADWRDRPATRVRT